MGKLLRKMWRYVTAALTGKFDEMADPKVQLEQAIADAQQQHRMLREQAANVIANQKQTEMKLSRAMEELERINGSARQALMMAADAEQKGDTAKATEYTAAAESFANRLIAVEHEVSELKELALQSAQASDQAKAMVQRNATNLQAKLAERQKLLSQLDQAKMSEQMNAAMTSLNETVGADVPTLAEVRDKIESRYAKARGAAELAGESVEVRMLEVQQAQMQTEAQARLSELRTQLGIGGPATAPPEVGEATGGTAATE